MSLPEDEYDKETILITLDQMGQTMEVMNDVMTKLRQYLRSSDLPEEIAVETEQEAEQVYADEHERMEESDQLLVH